MRKKWAVVGMSAVLGCLPMACASESDILSKRPGTGGRGGSGDSGAAAGGKPAGASGESSLDGGLGPSTGGSGNAQAGSGATSGGGPNGGSGGVTTGGASSSFGGANSYDPLADQKKKIIDALCGLLEDYPCLSYAALDPSRRQDVSYCSQLLRIHATGVHPECFDAWANEMRCLTRVQAQCPCSGNGCLLQPGSYPSPCPEENQAFLDCNNPPPAETPHGNVEGTAGTCHWSLNEKGMCDASCDPRPSKHVFSVICVEGAPGGPQYCTCWVDATRLLDGTDDDFLATQAGAFIGEDCADIAQKLADGKCDKILNCCFTWRAQGESVDRCSCLSDPELKGVSTCAEVAALGGGKVVDICPQNVLIPPRFPR